MTTAPTIANPLSGELIELRSASPGLLLEVVAKLKEREHQQRDWRWAAEEELLRRMDEAGVKLVIVGDQEISIRENLEAVWDVEEVELELAELVRNGRLQARLVADAIERVPRVNRGVVTRLLNMGFEELRRCRSWRRRSRRSIVVAPVPDLSRALPAGAPVWDPE
jgi:hypothetical protein